jgi:hypothetical protein
LKLAGGKAGYDGIADSATWGKLMDMGRRKKDKIRSLKENSR